MYESFFLKKYEQIQQFFLITLDVEILLMQMWVSYKYRSEE